MADTIDEWKEGSLIPYVQRIVKAVQYTGGDDHEDVQSILKALLLREREKETERCLKIMHKILGENFTYATLYGEIKHPNKDVDINELLREYTELEPERIKFSEFVEMKLSRLSGQQSTNQEVEDE